MRAYFVCDASLALKFMASGPNIIGQSGKRVFLLLHERDGDNFGTTQYFQNASIIRIDPKARGWLYLDAVDHEWLHSLNPSWHTEDGWLNEVCPQLTYRIEAAIKAGKRPHQAIRSWMLQFTPGYETYAGHLARLVTHPEVRRRAGLV